MEISYLAQQKVACLAFNAKTEWLCVRAFSACRASPSLEVWQEIDIILNMRTPGLEQLVIYLDTYLLDRCNQQTKGTKISQLDSPGLMTVVTSAGTPTTGSLAAAAGLPELLCMYTLYYFRPPNEDGPASGTVTSEIEANVNNQHQLLLLSFKNANVICIIFASFNNQADRATGQACYQ